MNDGIEITSVGAGSPHNEGQYEAGKALLVDSVAVGRDFCKSMITVATGAIPVYTALVGFAVGKDFRPKFDQGLLLSLSPGAFMLAAAAFAVGYFPKRSTFSLDVPSEIEYARKGTVSKRLRWSAIGFGLLILGIIPSGVGIFYSLSISGSAKS